MDFLVKKKDVPCCEKNVFFDKPSTACFNVTTRLLANDSSVAGGGGSDLQF